MHDYVQIFTANGIAFKVSLAPLGVKKNLSSTLALESLGFFGRDTKAGYVSFMSFCASVSSTVKKKKEEVSIDFLKWSGRVKLNELIDNIFWRRLKSNITYVNEEHEITS